MQTLTGMQTQEPHLMTPHCHWFSSYAPHHVPIKLADNNIVYSAGIGSVVFIPRVNGSEMRPIQLTRVLHVPNLRNNLLSVLFSTRQRGFIVKITGNAMYFNLNGETLFTASIDDNNSAYLDGTTKPVDTVFASSTLPLDISLWHRRLGHRNLDSITGLKIDSSQSPDPICEPCLAGKMHAS